MYSEAPYKPHTHDGNYVERGTPDKSWLQFLYIYYLVWMNDPDRSISVRELKKEYGDKFKEYNFGRYGSLYITNRSLELYKYGYLTKIKADGSNHNLYRINDDGLEKLEDRNIIPPDDRKKLVPLSKLINPRAFQMKAP